MVSILDRAAQELQTLLSDSEIEIGTVASGFEQLAQHTDAMVQLAVAVVGCLEDGSVLSVFHKVRRLGTEARGFIHERLEATAGILEVVTSEAKLLDRLSHFTHGQRSIARETQTLSVLTNIEVARLGSLGAGFQYLAHELDEFSESVVRGTKELSIQTNERRGSIEDTKRMLAAGLPRIRQDFARIEDDLEKALAVVEYGMSELSRTPAQFRGCVEEIAGQIAEVVAAIQAHDITRQQIEHVRDALLLISAKMRRVDDCEPGSGGELPRILCGLVIQAYQLKSIQATVRNWVPQIGKCMESIVRISSSEVVGIGPLVLKQERQLSQQLSRIDALEGECEADKAEIKDALAGLSSLMELVSDHLERSKFIRDRLRLLTFNSIIEASRLGIQADAILEISQSIKRISVEWSDVTDRSGQAKEQILCLVNEAMDGKNLNTQDGDDGLRNAQVESRAGLENLRAAAAFAARQAVEIEGAVGKLQAKIAVVTASGKRLEGCFARIDAVVNEIEELKRQFESKYPISLGQCNHAEVEAMFSIFYSTEIERDVLRAALCGAPVPMPEKNQAGNDVELF
jgi:methyl-accepting chemotaxis protein